MQLKLVPLFSFLFIGFCAVAQKQEFYFLSQPCLTPDGQTVIFSFEEDLWKMNLKDGNAVRLTAMQGSETDAKVSPDGKWIAFTGRQYGNADVFIMPVEGGDVKRLTYFSGSDNVSSWSWDSKSIYFTSTREGRQSSYKVSIFGETAERVFNYYYFLYDHNVFEHPSTGELFFNDTWESSNQVQRKKYKGPFNPDIQSYNPVTKQYKRYTDWIGKDFGATIDKKGNIFFISDEANGEYNLYTFENSKKTALTNFKTSIKNAFVNAGGSKVVFEKDYQLWIYDVASKKAEKLNVNIIRNNTLTQEKDFDVKGKIENFDISGDGKKMAFISRGELFVSDIEGKYVEQVKRGVAERAAEVKWLSDNKTLLFTQTEDGYENLFTVAADGSAGVKQITSDKKYNRQLVLNKKRTMAVFLSGRDEVKLLNTKTLEVSVIAKEEIWAFQSSSPDFSPDDNYIVFTTHRNFEQDILVYNIKEKTIVNLTNTAVSEADPLWSPDGKYIYFVSNRLKPTYPMGMDDSRIYRMPLQKYDAPYRSDKFNDLFKEEKKDSTKKKDSVQNLVKIDTVDIMDRLEHIGPSFGSQFLAGVYQDGDKTIVLYTSTHGEGRPALYKTVLDPFEAPKTEKIAGTDGSNADIVAVNNKYFALVNGTINKLNIEAAKTEPINISYTFRRNLSAEFFQMFYEAWAQVEQNYYDPHFHGTNWQLVKEHYAQFLPYINYRSDLRILLNDMLGELNSSHQGFSSFGEEENTQLKATTMETGIVFENKMPFKVKQVLSKSAADNKDVTIQKGDILVKVNGENVEDLKDRYAYFTRPSMDKELKLSFLRNNQLIEVKVHPQNEISTNIYDAWIDANQKRVDEKSGKRIAYSCMKNMGQGELEHFLIDMTKQLVNRDALILDLRYNTGGNVHDEVLRFLEQRVYLQWKYREGKISNQSNFYPNDKPIVLLTNEQSLSDAEMTAAGFKALKLGKIIGNDTYHWIIFTSGARLVDGSFVRLPSWGCYTLEGKDLELNGVQPDIKVVNSFEDKINGRDPQLDKAIEEILKQIK